MISCVVKACSREAVCVMRGMVALVLGLLFNLSVNDDLTLVLCQRHHAEAQLVARAVMPTTLDLSTLELVE